MKESKLATILALAALDDSEIKSLEQRVNHLAEIGFKPEIVEELPEEGNDHTLYLVPQQEPGEDPWYKEYLWLDNEWENIGTTSINFEDYYTKEEVNAAIEAATIQYTTMPTPTSEDLGKIVQYIGTSNNNYINGYFYECVSDGQEPAGYIWRTLAVQLSSDAKIFDTSDGYKRFTFDEQQIGLYIMSRPYVGRFMYRKTASEFGTELANYCPLFIFYFKHVTEIGTPVSQTACALMYGIDMSNYTLSYQVFNIDTSGRLIRTPTSITGYEVQLWNRNAQTFQGIKTFTDLPISTGTPTQNGQLVNKKYVDDAIVNNATQYSTMPAPAAGNEGEIIQYIGASTQDYIQGYYYICVSDGELEPTYSWEQINVQPNETLIINIGNRTIDELVDVGSFDADTPGMTELFNQLENFAEVFDNCGGNVNVRVINNNGDEYVAQLVRYGGRITYPDTFTCYFDLIGFDGTYSLCRDVQCASGGPSFWEFSRLTIQEFTNHKITSISSSSTNHEYPSAKAVYDFVKAGMPIYRYMENSYQKPFDFRTAEPGLYIPHYTLANSNSFYYTPGNGATVSYYTGHILFFVIYQKYQETGEYRLGEGYSITSINSSTFEGKFSMLDFYNYSGKMDVNVPYSTKYFFVSENAQLFKGVKTFESFPITPSSAPTTNYQVANKKYVDDKVAQINPLKYAIVEQLPTSDIDLNTIYLLLSSDPKLHNVYEEWMYINSEWELIGSTEVDLTNYLAKDNTIAYTPSGQYNPATKGYVDNYFFNGYESTWDAFTPQQQAAFAVAVVEYGLYDLTEEDESNLSSILGSEESIISDITEEEGIEITNQIIGGNN